MSKSKTREKRSGSRQKQLPQWKLLEQVVAMIERSITPRARVRHDVWLPDITTGKSRQCDIVIEQGTPPRQTVSIVEVQKRNRRIKIGELDAWWGKMRSVGAQHLICVSRHDFPKSVKEKVTQFYGPSVRLVRLRDLSEGQFPVGLSTVPFLVPNATLDASRRVQFDLEEPHDWSGDINASGTDRIFRRGEQESLSIAELMQEVSEKHQQPLRLPPGVHRGFFGLREPGSLRIIRGGRGYHIHNLLIPAIVEVTELAVPVSISSYEQVGCQGSLAWVAEATAIIGGETLGFRMTLVSDEQSRFVLREIEPSGNGRGAFLVFRGRLSNTGGAPATSRKGEGEGR